MPHKPIKYIKLYFIWRKNIQKFAYVQFLLYLCGEIAWVCAYVHNMRARTRKYIRVESDI